MHDTHFFVTLHLLIPFHVSATYVLHSFIRLIYPRISFIYVLDLLMRCAHSSLFMYQLRTCYICSCVVPALHSFMRHLCSQIALLYASYSPMRRTQAESKSSSNQRDKRLSGRKVRESRLMMGNIYGHY